MTLRGFSNPRSHYRDVRAADRRRELDRQTWAGTNIVFLTYDIVGSGELTTELLEFGTAFESIPFFSYGVEVAEGTELVSGDFPFVSAGVASWQVTETEDTNDVPIYLGAFVWIRVSSSTQYGLRFRFAFEGTALRNIEHFKGTA